MSLTPVTLLLLGAAVTALHLWSPAAAGSFPPVMRLERGLPLKGVDLDELRARDLARARARVSRRFLAAAGVVEFPVAGSANPFTVG